MKINDQKLGEILVKQNYFSDSDLKQTQKEATAIGTSLADYVISSGILSKDLFGQAIAEFLGIPYADLNSNQPPHEQVLRLPEDLAKKYHVVIYEEKDKEVIISTDNPDQAGLLEDLKKIIVGKKIKIAYSVGLDIDDAFIHYRKALGTKFAAILKTNKRFAPELINTVIDDAITYHASDVHFEPQGKEVQVRFRVDGILQEAGRIGSDYYENILNRIKVQANLRIDEHSKPQDGAIRFSLDSGVSADLRVSIVPTLEGEKVVMRVLSQYVKNFSLQEIGFNSAEQEQIEAAIKKPFGMILSTGPTGSGKTTTLYTLLKKLNRPDVNITTIEDPVEYRVLGLNQIQVNNQAGLTFAKGLRSIVRQDPNVILVGEIRDSETVEIAINAALTGHLLLSTFHANDAATAIPRLLEMGVEPFLLASTLEAIVAQRLVRKICEHCRYSEVVKNEQLKKSYPLAAPYFTNGKTTLYKSKGCESCNHSGFKGRVGVFEIIAMTPEMKDLIIKNPPAKEVWSLAKKQGARSLFESGWEKVKNGVTTLDEVMRIAPPIV